MALAAVWEHFWVPQGAQAGPERTEGGRKNKSVVSSQNGSGCSLGAFLGSPRDRGGKEIRSIVPKWFWLQSGSISGLSSLPLLLPSPSRSLPPPSLTHPFSHLNSPQLQSTLHTSTQLISTHFWTPRRSLFGAPWPPKSAQDRPKSPLDTSFFQKP